MQRLYEDLDFLPIRQSLYEIEDIAPSYDEDVCAVMKWCRPEELTKSPVYFSPSFTNAQVTMGTLPSHTFAGILMAVCNFSGYDLMENIFASRPEDFHKYGVYTCRFYVDGEWVEVITDTRIPCIRGDDGAFMPVYSRSICKDEMWVSLVEKAYSKAVGNYESILKINPHECLLHLTGGSVHHINFNETHSGAKKALRNEEQRKWTLLKESFEYNSILVTLPIDSNESKKPSTNANANNIAGGEQSAEGKEDNLNDAVDELDLDDEDIAIEDTVSELFIPGDHDLCLI
jgi:hypothetical protein